MLLRFRTNTAGSVYSQRITAPFCWANTMLSRLVHYQEEQMEEK